MEISPITGKAIGWLFSSGRLIWRRFRYSSRLSLSLGWQRPLITVLGERNPPRWRAIKLQATASKDEEFVLTKGFLEARKLGSWKWTSVEDLNNLLHLPMEIQKNRRLDAWIDGSSIAKRLEGLYTKDEQIEIRIISEDYHHAKTTSDVLMTTIVELLREDVGCS